MRYPVQRSLLCGKFNCLWYEWRTFFSLWIVQVTDTICKQVPSAICRDVKKQKCENVPVVTCEWGIIFNNAFRDFHKFQYGCLQEEAQHEVQEHSSSSLRIGNLWFYNVARTCVVSCYTSWQQVKDSVCSKLPRETCRPVIMNKCEKLPVTKCRWLFLNISEILY